MALANVAVALANRGRRVLVVDFDLEAPGLDTFDVMQPKAHVPGLIDFVVEYLKSGQAPSVERFISETSGVKKRDGSLWIMPSGHAENYATSFNEIDWGRLYAEQDGFLLFEDLKAQWRKMLAPDYVLIDSRTGHTDTGGICTRQLPDAVVVLFFPNEQNLRGLTRVVRDIRSEAQEPRNKSIELHFVMSNVPDLDDEDRILDEKKAAFQNQLEFSREPLIVHRYDSLSLLNQVLFVKDRPRSRLANEYLKLVSEIAVRNTADRDGALEYIRRLTRSWADAGVDDTILTAEDRLVDIQEKHSSDGEVLFRLAEHYKRIAEPDRVRELVQKSISSGYEDPRAYLTRAQIRAKRGNPSGASDDARRVLDSDRASPPMLSEAISLIDKFSAKSVAESTAVKSLSNEARLWLASKLNRSLDELGVADRILMTTIDLQEQPPGQSEPYVRHAHERDYFQLSLVYIGTGRFTHAMDMLLPSGKEIGELGKVDTFNYGMAKWGYTGLVSAEVFQRVVELDQAEDSDDDDVSANYQQCLSIASWANGDKKRALKHVEGARNAIEDMRRYGFRDDGIKEFSCWRYYEVDNDEFVADLNEIAELINGDDSRKPHFITR